MSNTGVESQNDADSAGKFLAEKCPSDDDILTYLPGELSGPKAESIAAHLETCPLCRSRVRVIRQRLSDDLPAARRPLAPRSAVEQVPSGSDDLLTQFPHQKPRVPPRLNEYELLEPIGRGGMGLVYRARHVRLQRTVAIKVLPHLALADESAVVRMQRELAAAGRVQHPNIVYATDAGECDGIHYLVMEYVQGIDLSKLVAISGPLPIAAACEIIRQAALGLAHIARCHVVHRDLKPSNMMLVDDGTVKILDLGLALLREGQLESEDSATQSGYLLGTADYVAPEQLLDSHDADVRSDLYSLGCSFYKLLTGQAPFGGSEHSSVAKKLNAHQYVPPPAIRDMRPDAPPEVAMVLERLLAKRPADRLQTPAELVEALMPLAVGADLRTLCATAYERAELEGLSLLQPSRTPCPPKSQSSCASITKLPPSAISCGSAIRPAWWNLAWWVMQILRSLNRFFGQTKEISSNKATERQTLRNRSVNGGVSKSRKYAAEIPAHAVASREAFLGDLPELLQSFPGWAVAYRDGKRIGMDTSRRELFWRLVREGEEPERFYLFVVERAEPIEADIMHSP